MANTTKLVHPNGSVHEVNSYYSEFLKRTRGYTEYKEQEPSKVVVEPDPGVEVETKRPRKSKGSDKE